MESWTEERETLIRRGLIYKLEGGEYCFLSSAFWEWLIDNLYHLEEAAQVPEPDITHLQQQYADHRRRLEILEGQAATFGDLYAPPHLVIDIENTKAKLASLEAVLEV